MTRDDVDYLAGWIGRELPEGTGGGELTGVEVEYSDRDGRVGEAPVSEFLRLDALTVRRVSATVIDEVGDTEIVDAEELLPELRCVDVAGCRDARRIAINTRTGHAFVLDNEQSCPDGYRRMPEVTKRDLLLALLAARA